MEKDDEKAEARQPQPETALSFGRSLKIFILTKDSISHTDNDVPSYHYC